MHSLTLASSFIYTYSATQLRPSIRTQSPILQRHDTMLFSMYEPLPTVVLPIIAQFLSLVPLLMRQCGPMTTFGPILQFSSTTAVLSISVC